MILTAEAKELVWVEWEDAYSVYQPSSAETHFFNETTGLLLDSLKQGPLTLEAVADYIAESMNLEINESIFSDLEFAASRLEELGLVDWPERASPSP